jgi:putative Mg2+ transporter-C (MgtC) family protein
VPGTVPAMISLVAQLTALAYTVVAMVCGIMIGAERKRADKPTGMRTHALIAGSAALIVYISSIIDLEIGRGDPTRTLHAVITGIGFLGAGAIYMRSGANGPGGITTAATVFATAIIGAVVGLGAPVAALGATLLTLFVLRVIPMLTRGRSHTTDDGVADPSDDF